MNADWNPWKSLLVLQVAVLLVGCGVIASIWRCVEFVVARDEQSQAELERFHSESIAALEKLAMNAGVMTSAELCPVRFRLRSGGGHNIPLCKGGDGTYELSTWTQAGLEGVGSAKLDAAGTLDFGLNPPGDYQLLLTMTDGMHLTHEFKVLPGVPIDRLVYCPQPALGDDRTVQVEIVWPPEMRDAPPVAICRIEPAPFVEHEWEWEPAADWGPVLLPAHPYDPQQWDVIARDGHLQSSGLPVAERPEIPYLYCQISDVMFYVASELAGDEEPRMTHLATVCFGAPEHVVETPVSVGSIWNSSLTPPRFGTLNEHNELQLPHEVTALLQHLMAEL